MVLPAASKWCGTESCIASTPALIPRRRAVMVSLTIHVRLGRGFSQRGDFPRVLNTSDSEATPATGLRLGFIHERCARLVECVVAMQHDPNRVRPRCHVSRPLMTR